MKKSKIGVFGIGEVGKAIASIFSKKYLVLKKDIDYDGINQSKLEVLHVCIPYGPKFKDTVLVQIKKNHPRLVIIHSTVRPGTTKEIFNKSQTLIVHSPIMGIHPNLAKDILRFTKFVGPTNKKSGTLAKNHLQSVGIKVTMLDDSLQSEIGKLLDTTYYAWNIVFCKMVGELCNKQNLNFSKVYTLFNEVYNSGYQEMKPNVVRPILKYEKGQIGGHCLIPNAKILNDYTKLNFTDFILKVNESFEKSV